MKFCDRVQLKEEYRNYEGEQILDEVNYIRIDKEVSKILTGKIAIVITSCIYGKEGNVMVSLGEENGLQYYTHIDMLELIEDEKKYTELELQAHKNDSFEKGVEKGIEEENKWREETLKTSKRAIELAYKEGIEKAINDFKQVWIDKGYETGYKEGLEQVRSDEFEEILDTEFPTYNNHPHNLITALMNVIEENGFYLNGYDDDSHGNIDINIKVNKLVL